MRPGRIPFDGTGRALPPVPGPGVKTKALLFPALSLHVPFTVARVTRAYSLTGAASGAGAPLTPNPIVPSGFRNAVPSALAADAAPHWSSTPSSVSTAPSCRTFSVWMLQ